MPTRHPVAGHRRSAEPGRHHRPAGAVIRRDREGPGGQRSQARSGRQGHADEQGLGQDRHAGARGGDAELTGHRHVQAAVEHHAGHQGDDGDGHQGHLRHPPPFRGRRRDQADGHGPDPRGDDHRVGEPHADQVPAPSEPTEDPADPQGPRPRVGGGPEGDRGDHGGDDLHPRCTGPHQLGGDVAGDAEFQADPQGGHDPEDDAAGLQEHLEETSRARDVVAVQGVLGGGHRAGAGQQGDHPGGDHQRGGEVQPHAGRRAQQHQNQRHGGRDRPADGLHEEAGDPAPGQPLDGDVDQADGREGDDDVEHRGAVEGGHRGPHHAHVHRDEPLLVQPGGRHQVIEALAGRGRLDPPGADVGDQLLEASESLIVGCAGADHPQRGDGVVVQGAVLGDDHRAVGDVDVDVDAVGVGDPQPHRDGLRRGGAHRDRHHRYPHDEVEDLPGLGGGHLVLAHRFEIAAGRQRTGVAQIPLQRHPPQPPTARRRPALSPRHRYHPFGSSRRSDSSTGRGSVHRQFQQATSAHRGGPHNPAPVRRWRGSR
ncbi:hypothetical protein PACID_06120 [Acidipropionibacterium acidipropionici ATCC 4875]|uniref:Uncharacterized protein n=1 Tax=Acidipropionibacterium acidipropionici (strain ATCC 4875 / DSM 20272 / JCM 6432 / NBRC 12425 / NCIMB 8070 / 4) TaxID=1171373 RepID=K7S1M7_ACIA4|nr:hypothetical protein PACID_06120 [Acidipropionibacterium acidipropionici ATCC 4875]